MLLAFWSRISVTDHNFPLPNLHSSLMHPRALSGTDQRKNKGFACTDDFGVKSTLSKCIDQTEADMSDTLVLLCVWVQPYPGHCWHRTSCPQPQPPSCPTGSQEGCGLGRRGVLPTSFRWKWCSVLCQLCIELYQHQQVYKGRTNHLLFN